MNNNLVLEINRMYEIMGLQKKVLLEKKQIKEVGSVSNKKLLIESSIFGKLKEAIDGFVRNIKIRPSVNGIRQNIMAGTVEVEERVWNLFKDFIRNPTLPVNVDDIVEFMRILSQNKEIVDKAYKFLIPNILESEKMTEQLFIKRYSDIMKKNGNIDLKTLLTQTLGEENATLLYKKISDKIDTYDAGKFVKEVDVPIPDVGVRILTPSQINTLNKVVTTSKTFVGDFRELYKKKLDDIKDEIYQLSNGFKESMINVAGPGEIEKIINAYSVAISRKLDLLEIKAADASLEILEKNNLPPEILKKLKDSEDQFFKTFRDIREDESKKFFDTVKDTLFDFMKEIGGIFKGFFKLKENTIFKILNPTTNVGQFFWTGQWASVSKLWKLAIRTSSGQNKAKYFFAAIIASGVGSIVGATAVNTLMTIFDFLKAAWNEITKRICGEDNKIGGGKVIIDCEKFQFEIGAWYKDVKDNILESGLQAFVENGWNNMIKEMTNHPVLGTLLKLVPGPFLTYPDSLAIKILDAIGSATGREGKVSEDLNIRNFIYSLFGTTEKEVEEEIKKAEEDVKDEGIEDTTTPTDSITTTTPTDTTTTTEPVTPEPPSTEFTVDSLLQKYPALRGNNSEITKNSDGTFSELMPNTLKPDTIIIVNSKAYYQYTDSKGVQQLFPVQQK